MIWVLIISVFLVGYVAGGLTMFAYVEKKLGIKERLKAQGEQREASKYWFDR